MTFQELKELLDQLPAETLSQDVSLRLDDEWKLILATTFDKRVFFAAMMESDDG